MQLGDFKLLTDENIDPLLVGWLRMRGFDVVDVKEQHWTGRPDTTLLAWAYAEERVILTHDSDFGTLIFTTSAPFRGIVFLRPGHFDAAPHIESLEAVLRSDLVIQPPFLLTVEHTRISIKIRLRTL